MTKQKSTKRALLMSALSLLLCVSMLVGSTFAWFTDSVTSTGNKIQSGTLKIDLELLDKEGNWTSIKDSRDPIFNYDLWEPGYTDVKILKVENEGNLALKWIAKFVSTYQLSKLADVIDVYVKAYGVVDDESSVSYPDARNLEGYTRVGTVAEFVNTISETTYGSLNVGESAYLGIGLKMQESAGNEYQGLDLGGAFDIQILATQDTVESDSFNNQYDKDAEYEDDAPLAKVTILNNNSVIKNPNGVTVLDKNLSISTDGGLNWGINLGNALSLDTAYQFEPSLSVEEAEASEYANWHADFVVYANKDVPAYSLALAGYYDAWCQYNNDAWVALASDEIIKANEEIRLVGSMGGITVSYTELSEYGNDGIGFLCGAVELTNEMLKAANINATTEGLADGTVLTVELRLYEATGSSMNTETDDYIVVGRYDYKF